MPRTSAWLSRQLPEASLLTHGRIAALISCELVCGSAPGLLVTQKCVTPSSTYVGSFQVVGREVDRVPDLVVEFVDYEWLGKGNLKSRTEGIWDKVEISGTTATVYGTVRPATRARTQAMA